MKKYFFFLLLLGFYSCSDDAEVQSIKDCVWSDDVSKVFDKFDDPRCNYTDVLLYEGELHTVCYCCACGKALSIISCDGSQLCIADSNCFENFFEDAEYQFSYE